MEHESFVPIPPARLAQALRSPAALADSLPGWQPDRADTPAAANGDAETTETPADADPAPTADAAEAHPADANATTAKGRLRLRVAGSTITYRGTVTLTGTTSPFTLEAQGEEVRGSGTVQARLELTLAATEQPEPGTTVTFRGTAEAGGRLTTYDDAVVEAAVRRLLDRFSAELAAHAPEAEDEEPDVVDDDGEPVPPGELEEFELVEVEVEVPESAAALDDLVTPAEAAHARRTMIGRSAEEVDHAPPRGRYAPVPAPDAGTASATLRWAAPAAAALLASAVVVGRVLRRRR
ncbi:CoxG family protein [Actinacidiphila acidipaludis]|uniref:Carbon monoxide dehydrogenase subunit G n=1 Tax=Actinacidiphila acidipaludis TaxID=2873382 RepID=A0ABS7QEV0_9ACTN|nr:carbon monoxide dehydrogenase subunit G [Streptomyces acidipaludis]MBY8881371.1 carbon monoxide dehydrogenase subunit G [Streptomyces acidipaludis]